MRTTTKLRIALAPFLLAALAPAHAFDARPSGFSLEVGAGKNSSCMAGVGLVWDWNFERLRKYAELTAHTELLLNRWRADALGGGDLDLTQVVVLPSLRMRLDRGASPWFIELGIGASWMDHDFVTPRKQFSTRWNFYDVVGMGHTFGGPGGKHELGLRWNHVSNGGLRHPNPGQDFIQVRYVMRF